MENVKVEELKHNAEVELMRKVKASFNELTAREIQDVASRLGTVLDDPNPINKEENLMNLVTFSKRMEKFVEALKKEYSAMFDEKMEKIFENGQTNVTDVCGADISISSTEVWDFSGDGEWNDLNKEVFRLEDELKKAKDLRKSHESILKTAQERDPIGVDYFKGRTYKSAAVKIK